MLPNFLIIGDFKAATTSLYAYLRQHPDIYMPALKELRYFAFDPSDPAHIRLAGTVFPITSEEKYREQFAHATTHRALGEASPVYLRSPIAPDRIRDALPHVKLIASLREPVGRLYSMYLMERRAGRENLPFDEAIRAERSWVTTSYYSRTLRRYYDLFPGSRLKVILLEDISRDTSAVIRDIFVFLNVEPGVHVNVSPVHNSGGLPRSPTLHRLLSLTSRHRTYRPLIKRIAPPPLLETVRRIRAWNTAAPPPVPDTLRTEITARFAEDSRMVEDMIGRDLSHWRPPAT